MFLQSLSPGVVNTDFEGKSLGKETADHFKQAFLAGHAALNAQDIADGIIYVLSTPPHVTVRELTIAPTNQPHF